MGKKMGNYRFRFSDMMPNAWFYKLKDMNRSRKHFNSTNKKHPASSSSSTSLNSQPTHSYYFKSQLTDPPRTSSSIRKTQRKTIYKPSPKLVSSSSCNGCQLGLLVESSPAQDSSDYSLSPLQTSPESLLSDTDEDEDSNNFALPQSFDQLASSSWSTSCRCKLSSSNTDIIIDVNNDSCNRKLFKKDGLEAISELELPPILTKPAKVNGRSCEFAELKKRSSVTVDVRDESAKTTQPKWNSPGRKSPINSTGIRLRSNSPRIANKKIQAFATRKSVSSSNTYLKSKNKSVSDSFAVEKSSVDPQRDFRESMVEMILGNNIRTSKDLEDLLACYLSLNSTEYHHLIVKAFEQIWFDMSHLRL